MSGDVHPGLLVMLLTPPGPPRGLDPTRFHRTLELILKADSYETSSLLREAGVDEERLGLAAEHAVELVIAGPAAFADPVLEGVLSRRLPELHRWVIRAAARLPSERSLRIARAAVESRLATTQVRRLALELIRALYEGGDATLRRRVLRLTRGELRHRDTPAQERISQSLRGPGHSDQHTDTDRCNIHGDHGRTHTDRPASPHEDLGLPRGFEL
jgi:hypothetical protein